ncbi:hypothetical protein [Streptomyces sp. Wb2n-11]|uniref:hypothetical protein n=1 Tax=Streptomyces sp. Wb2n-11 TaxID=1030533 RepID=UPI000B076227|nr:hypothetical protein [Streptomyces sp. Wb2n-11]
MDTTHVPAWPRYQLTADPDGTVSVAGPAAPTDTFTDRAAAIKAVAELASRLRPPRPVRADAHDDTGTTWPLVIHPDGTATEAGPAAHSRKTKRRSTRPSSPEPTPAPPTVALPTPAPPPAPTSAATPPRVRSGVQRLFAQRQLPRPTRSTAIPAPAAAPRDSAVPTVLTIRKYADAGDLSRAAALAGQLDDAMSAMHGPSHPQVLEVRTLRADVTAAQGDLPTAIGLYRDVAERWLYAGDPEAAAQLADRAHTLWQQIADAQTAAAIGSSIIRMRSQIPGQNGAYEHARRHQATLQAR